MITVIMFILMFLLVGSCGYSKGVVDGYEFRKQQEKNKKTRKGE